MKLFRTGTILFLLSIIFVPSFALAQLSGPTATPTATTTKAPTSTWSGEIVITNETGVNDIGGVASKVIVWLLAVIAMVAAIIIIYAGILLVFNGGNEARIKQAKTTLTWAIVGLVVAIGAFAIVSIIQGVFS